MDFLEETEMSNYSENDFYTQDDGLDYVFATMGAIYGASFSRHFESMDPDFVRQVWMDQIGIFLTYKPSLDFAIQHLNPEFIPSAIKFRDLCNSGPSIPQKGVVQIEHNPTPVDPQELEKVKQEGLKKLRELRNTYKGKF